MSNLGDGVFVIALPLLATRVTDDPVSVGLIAAFFTIPWLLFALPVGVIIDRSDRRRVLIVSDLCRAALVGAFALVVAFGDVQIWMLWLLAFGLGIGEVFFDSGSQTILPAIVPEAQLERANGFFYATEVATNTFIGMPLGGALIAVAVWLPFGVDAASFVLAAALAATVSGSFRPTATAPASTEPRPVAISIVTDMRAGVRWLLDQAVLRSLVVVVALMNLAFAATQATFVLFAKDELNISDGAFGPLLALVGLGALVAGLTGGKLIEAVGRRAVMVTAALIPAATSALIGMFPNVWVAIPLTALQAFTTTIWSIVAVSLRQQIVPTHLFGRVNSIYRWISTGAMPLGALFGGVMAGAYGLRTPYFAAAGLLMLASAAIITRLSPQALDAVTPLPLLAEAPVFEASDETPLSLTRDPLDVLLDDGQFRDQLVWLTNAALGLDHHTVRLRPTTREWVAAGARLRSIVEGSLTGLVAGVQQIGSSSVVGLLAKPIVDLAAGVGPGHQLVSIRSRLALDGWIYRGDAGESGGHVFVLDARASFCVAHLHVVEHEGQQWLDYLLFRDVLLESETARARYEAVKQQLVREVGDDRVAYTVGKSVIVRQLLMERRR